MHLFSFYLFSVCLPLNHVRQYLAGHQSYFSFFPFTLISATAIPDNTTDTTATLPLSTAEAGPGISTGAPMDTTVGDEETTAAPLETTMDNEGSTMPPGVSTVTTSQAQM